jgi:cytochrome c2
LLVACAVAALLVAVFGAGAYAGRWATKNHVASRVRALIADVFRLGVKQADTDVEWQSTATHLVRIESTIIQLTDEGWGGGIQPLADGRLFYGTRTGGFGVLGNDGLPRIQAFEIDMNLAALMRHPVYSLANFNPVWFRVTDIDLARVAENRYDLLVGHHYFDAENECVELRLSGAQVGEAGGTWSLLRPFETLFKATPCITFNPPDHHWVFEGHFSGGRIARLANGEVLFTTGDHGWIGLRGHPALSADDSFTLGKVLLIDPKTRSVEVFATGVRNTQGLHVDSLGRLWATDHGPRGGDELNLIRKGENFGWPYATLGTDYGPRAWPYNSIQGRPTGGVPPVFAWVPSIGVSNLIEVRGEEFALWKGDLLVLSLAQQTMHRLRLEGEQVVYDEPIRFDGMRLRDIAEFPDGRIALWTDGGQVVLLRNADRTGRPRFLEATPEELPAAPSAGVREAAGAAVQRLTGGQIDSPGLRVFLTHCATCHSFTNETGAGPSLKGVVGRAVGATDFAYSEALSRGSGAWTSRRIVDFALKPTALYPNTTMAPVSLTMAQQRDLVSFFDNSAN